MSITHTTGSRNVIADALVDLNDVGATDANGDLVYMTSGDAEVAILAMSNPSFDAAGAPGGNAAGLSTAEPIADDTNATGGTIALFKWQDRNNAEVLRGSVTATGGGGDIELSSLVIGNGDTVKITSLTYTAAT